MTVENRVKAFSTLGRRLNEKSLTLQEVMNKAYLQNPWFTIDNQQLAIDTIVENYLDEKKLNEWISKYPNLKNASNTKRVGLILAGNIPLVGFHDLLCVLITGNIALVKCSEKDSLLSNFIIQELIEIDPEFKELVKLIERLESYDAVIATGSNNSARYFEQYFATKPHIIRKNRQAVSVLSGKETDEELQALGADIFTYFGLGCRNVSKLYVPLNYDFTKLLDVLHSFNKIILHNSYKNNFDYQSAIWLLNKVQHFVTGSILITEEKSISSKIATLHYEFYNSAEELRQELINHEEEIQEIVGHLNDLKLPIVPFGNAQTPSLFDYADGVDTMEFLTGI